MSAAATIATKDLRLRLRDRSFFLIGIVAPFGLALIFSLLLGPITGGSFHPEIGVVDGDGSAISQAFVEALHRLDADGTIVLTTGMTESDASRLVDGGELGAAYVIPGGFGADVTAGRAAALRVLGNVDSSTTTQIAAAIADRFVQDLRATQLSVATALHLGGGSFDPAAVEEAAASPDPISLGEIDAATRELDAETYYVAAMAIFFVFFTVSTGVTGLLDESREGTMSRLLAAPIPRSAIVTGKALVSLVLGLVSMTVLAVASTLLIGADWGNPLGAAMLIVSSVVAAVGIMAVVAGFASTPESAGNIQSIIAVTLGALGGSFFQISLAEGVLSKVALLTPHHWFLRGLADLAGGVSPVAILPSVAAILAFGVITGTIGWVLLRRKVTR